MDDRRWPAEWLRGVLELCVLGVLARERAYGYVIAQRLEEAGLGTVKGGTLYPLLARLERDGHVRSTWAAGDGGPGRKYVALTDTGREELRQRTEAWLRFVHGTSGLLPDLTPPATPAGADPGEGAWAPAGT